MRPPSTHPKCTREQIDGTLQLEHRLDAIATQKSDGMISREQAADDAVKAVREFTPAINSGRTCTTALRTLETIVRNGWIREAVTTMRKDYLLGGIFDVARRRHLC